MSSYSCSIIHIGTKPVTYVANVAGAKAATVGRVCTERDFSYTENIRLKE